jgi:hypothetical protein
LVVEVAAEAIREVSTKEDRRGRPEYESYCCDERLDGGGTLMKVWVEMGMTPVLALGEA